MLQSHCKGKKESLWGAYKVIEKAKELMLGVPKVT